MVMDGWTPIYGGGQAHIWEVSKRLVKNHGCKVDILTRKLKDENKKKFVKKEFYYDNKLKIIRVGPTTKFWNLFGRVLSLFSMIKPLVKNNYDIIHAHAYLSAFPTKIAKVWSKKPLVFTIHGTGLDVISDMNKNRFTSFVKTFFEKFILFKLKYDQEISVDSSVLKYKNRNKNLLIIPNGVDVKSYDKIIVSKSKKFKIIFVGRIHPQKGLEYLIKAMPKIISKNPLVEVHIIGTGELEKELKELSKQLNVEKNVFFRGKIFSDALIKEYKSSHLFVLPSLYEGQPLTLLEAWAAKLPVVVTNVGGNKDFVVNEQNGYIIKVKDIDLLAATINKAIRNENLKKIGEEGYRIVNEKYDWDRITERIFLVYKNIIKSKN